MNYLKMCHGQLPLDIWCNVHYVLQTWLCIHFCPNIYTEKGKKGVFFFLWGVQDFQKINFLIGKKNYYTSFFLFFYTTYETLILVNHSENLEADLTNNHPSNNYTTSLFGKVGGHVKQLFIFPSAPHTSSMDILIIHEKSPITSTM